jgi:outer membrane protein assembly factor BamB
MYRVYTAEDRTPAGRTQARRPPLTNAHRPTSLTPCGCATSAPQLVTPPDAMLGAHMLKPLLLSVVALSALTLPALAGPADYLPSDELHPTGLMKFWQLQVPLSPGQTVVDAYVVGDQMYVCTHDGYVFGIHAPTGAIRWVRQVTRLGYRIQRPIHEGTSVIFGTPAALSAYERVFGDGVWRHSLPFSSVSTPILDVTPDGSYLYLAGYNARIYGYHYEEPREAWKAGLKGPVAGGIVPFDGSLYMVTRHGYVYAVDPAQREELWERTGSVDARVQAPVAVNDDGVFVADTNRRLTMFNRKLGTVAWRATFDGPLYDAPTLIDRAAYQFCPDEGLVAVDIDALDDDSRFLWRLPRGRRVVTADEQRLFVLSRDEKLLAVERATGRVLHEIDAAGMTLAEPQLSETAVYLFSADGRIFVARPKDASRPRRDDVVRGLAPAAPASDETVGPSTTTGPAVTNPLDTSSAGRPIGGRSDVTRNWGEDGDAQP